MIQSNDYGQYISKGIQYGTKFAGTTCQNKVWSQCEAIAVTEAWRYVSNGIKKRRNDYYGIMENTLLCRNKYLTTNQL